MQFSPLSCHFIHAKQTEPPSLSALMMEAETVSKTLDQNFILAWLIT
jgi:hypothetical protein